MNSNTATPSDDRYRIGGLDSYLCGQACQQEPANA